MEKRDLPWREKKDPYQVWLSEIILQQTRVDQGLPYYFKFIENFGTVNELSKASEQEVLKLWQGLGYYSRGRNLLKAAKMVVSEFGGEFPSDSKTLMKLPGVGKYTASAIASICFNEVIPVVDGNVFRVASRFFGLDRDISDPKSQRIFSDILLEVISKSNPGDFNQGLMELGALVCSPASPDCPSCPLREDCFAYKNRQQQAFPVKTKKVKVKEVWFHYLVFEYHSGFALKLRKEGDIWQGLYDFHLIELEDNQGNGHALHSEIKSLGVQLNSTETFGPFKHLLTHRKINAYFHHYLLENETSMAIILNKYGLKFFSQKEIVNLPFPKLIANFLEKTLTSKKLKHGRSK